MNTMIATYNLGDPGADDKQLFVLKAPSDSIGGGVRLLAAYAVNNAATAAGTTFTLALHKYSSAGTPAVNGTIAAAVGGTADYWADSVPKSFTLDSDYTFLDAGEWLVADYQEVATGSPTAGSLVVQYALGN